MRSLALILALMAGTFALAVPPAQPGQPDDMEGILGNEECAWDESEGAMYYELKRSDDPVVCLTVTAPSALVSATPCVERDVTAHIHVRACDDSGCSDWVGTASFDPWVCLRGDCEEPCYLGAPLRLEERYPSCTGK